MVEYTALIVDDDVWMQRILAQTVKSYGFKKILLASNGFDGVAIAVDKVPDLIISDIMMPELSGHLVLRLLKTIKCTKDIPVLMVSALSDVDNLSKAVKQGTAGFISKPFTRATVYEKLVDVYGEEKLEKIKKGIPIGSMANLYSPPEDDSPGSPYASGNVEDDSGIAQEDEENIKNIKDMLFDD